MWNLKQGCEITSIDKGYMIARFYSKADYMKVLNGGSWMILGHYLLLTKWRPNFKVMESEANSTLIWIRLSELPLEMFDDKSLLRIGEVVRRAIKVDRYTEVVGKDNFARICVGINLSKPLPPNVLVWGVKRPVEYEGLLKICYKCGCYGHKMEGCRTQGGMNDG